MTVTARGGHAGDSDAAPIEDYGLVGDTRTAAQRSTTDAIAGRHRRSEAALVRGIQTVLARSNTTRQSMHVGRIASPSACNDD